VADNPGRQFRIFFDLEIEHANRDEVRAAPKRMQESLSGWIQLV
jgi:hypothetical protein